MLSIDIFFVKVKKILKGRWDSIPSPLRSHEHLNFLFLFLWPNIAWHCQQTFLYKQTEEESDRAISPLYTDSRPDLYGVNNEALDVD